MKRLSYLLFLILLINCSAEESLDSSDNAEYIEEINFETEPIDIYEFGEGPYTLAECSSIGESLKTNITKTGLYILQIENTSEYIRNSSNDNLDTVIMFDVLMGNKKILPLSEASDEYNDIAKKTYFIKFPYVLDYLDKHKEDISNLYVARDIVDGDKIQFVFDFKELSIMTQGSDKNIELLIEFKDDPDHIYFFEGLSGMNLSIGKEAKIKELFSRYDFIVDTGKEFRGSNLSYQKRSEYFYNNLVYTTVLPIKNGEYTEEWYIALLENHLKSLNEFSFFITVYPECEGDLKIQNIVKDLNFQYTNIELRLKDFKNFAGIIENTVVYPKLDYFYSIKDSLLNY